MSQAEKIKLMQRSHFITVTSVKEGWGLVVTEANSQGTPAIVYNVDGLRDSVVDNKTGLICRANTPHALADKIGALVQDTRRYDRLRRAAWQHSKQITFDKSYNQFKELLTS